MIVVFIVQIGRWSRLFAAPLRERSENRSSHHSDLCLSVTVVPGGTNGFKRGQQGGRSRGGLSRYLHPWGCICRCTLFQCNGEYFCWVGNSNFLQSRLAVPRGSISDRNNFLMMTSRVGIFVMTSRDSRSHPTADRRWWLQQQNWQNGN